MPAPPTEIRIKRKATDDPVELLHVQNDYNGLRQIKQYVFKRQRTSTAPNNDILNSSNPDYLSAPYPTLSSPGIPLVTKPSQPSRTTATNSQRPDQNTGSQNVAVPDIIKASTDKITGHEIGRQSSVAPRAEPRRFHLSRSPIISPAGSSLDRIRGAKGPPAIFIERRHAPELATKVSNASNSHGLSAAPQNASNDEHKNGLGETQVPSTEHQSRSPAPLRNVKLPSGKFITWDADSATLAAQMQAYTMQEIGHNMAMVSGSDNSTFANPAIRVRQVSSFKPRTAAARHNGRQSEARVSNGRKESNRDEIMTEATDLDVVESGYVMDTYIRMPAEMFEFEEQRSIGLLVLDSQPDIDEFYNDDSDSDSEIYDEEEDENAENHPSTDYPEDEIESDDEYGRNTYQRYRNCNTSDNEEYDEDDVTYSDDEARHPWTQRPWMVNNAYHRNAAHEDCDD